MHTMTPPMPLPEKCAFAKLGSSIETARLLRRIPTALKAKRAFVERSTLQVVGQGDPGISLSIDAAQSDASD